MNIICFSKLLCISRNSLTDKIEKIFSIEIKILLITRFDIFYNFASLNGCFFINNMITK